MIAVYASPDRNYVQCESSNLFMQPQIKIQTGYRVCLKLALQ